MIAPVRILRGALPLSLVQRLNELLARGAFGDAVTGRRSTETSVRIAWAEESEAAHSAAALVEAALEQSEAFRAATFPAAMMTPRFHRYDAGMRHADHTDPALLGGGSALLRRDIAMTIALNLPNTCEGGELTFDLGVTTHRWQGEPGDCILYSPDVVHRVEPVTRGARLLAVSWVESTIQNFEHRRILSEIGRVLKELETGDAPEPHVDALHDGYSNLVRLWS